MDKRSAGVARYNDHTGEHKGLYVSPGWLKGIGAVGVAGTALVGMIMWLSARPPRDEVEKRIETAKVEQDKRLDTARAEIRQEMQTLRVEIRQDIQDMRVELRKLLRSTREK